jgi:hypothetical protein
MCAHQTPHLEQRLILVNEANTLKHKTTLQVENTNNCGEEEEEDNMALTANVEAYYEDSDSDTEEVFSHFTCSEL